LLEKPSGLACHGPDKETLAGILSQNNISPLLCHRLDKESSGLMLVAKSSESADVFRQLFENDEIEKFYFSLCEKKGKKKQGSIKGNIEKSRNGNWKLTTSEKPTTLTQFFSFSLPINGISSRAFIVKIMGGKTHQIRVALKSNASPIMGDQRYGGLKYARLCLHAYALRFNFKGEAFCFLSEIDFLESVQDATQKTLTLKELNQNFNDADSPWDLPWPKVKL